MSFTSEALTISGREVLLRGDREAPVLLVQPVDDHDLEVLDSECAHIAVPEGRAAFCLAAFRVRDWNDELSPWPAPPVFGNEPFGDGARETLDWVERAVLPALDAGKRRAVCVGGYSLAGLFALYAAWESDAFTGAAGVSPSVWFPGWLEHAKSKPPRAGHIYLSLGDREERARNIMGTVGDNIRALHAHLQRETKCDAVLEWNPGNHFRDPDLRTARGFTWLLDRLSPSN